MLNRQKPTGNLRFLDKVTLAAFSLPNSFHSANGPWFSGALDHDLARVGHRPAPNMLAAVQQCNSFSGSSLAWPLFLGLFAKGRYA